MPEEYTAKRQMEAEPETVGRLPGISLMRDDYTISLFARMTNDDILNKYRTDTRDIAIDVPPRLTIKAMNAVNINYTGKITSGPDSEIISGKIVKSLKIAYFIGGGIATPIGKFAGSSWLDITADNLFEIDCNMRRQRTFEFLLLGSRISATFKDGTILSGDRDSFTADYVSDNGGQVINLDEILKRDGERWKLRKKVKNFYVFDEDQIHGITIRYSIVYE